MAPSCNLCSTPCEKKCSKCCKVYYCSIEHQKEDWKTHRKDCHPCKIETHQGKGRMLVATKDLKPYSLILKEEALVSATSYVTEQRLIPKVVCISCLTYVDEEDIMPCSKCGWPVCGIKCENDKVHADGECPVFSKNKIRPDTTSSELILQVTRCILLKERDLSKYKALMNLESNLAILADNIYFFAQCGNALRVLRAAFKSVVDLVEISIIVGILYMNMIHSETEAVPNNQLTRISGHLYATACLANHSCVPNAKPMILMSGNLRLLAIREIKLGDEITITYCPLTKGNLMRQEHIKRYHFSCRCERCLDPTELGTFFSSVKCGKCPSGFASPKTNNGNGGIEWICGSCSKPKGKVQLMLNKIEKEVKTVIGTAIYSQHSIRKYEAMRQKCEQFLHPNHFLMFDLEYDFVGFLHNYHSMKLSNPNLQSTLQKIIVKIGYKLLAILDKISPGPRLIRGRLLYFLATGLSDETMQNTMTDGLIAQILKKKIGGQTKLKLADPECVATFKKVVSEAAAILELEPPEAEDHGFAFCLRDRLDSLL